MENEHLLPVGTKFLYRYPPNSSSTKHVISEYLYEVVDHIKVKPIFDYPYTIAEEVKTLARIEHECNVILFDKYPGTYEREVITNEQAEEFLRLANKSLEPTDETGVSN